MHLFNPSKLPTGDVIFELFVQEGYCEYELAAVTVCLQTANDVCQRDFLRWRFASDTPGLVNGAGGGMVRANPAIPDHFLADCLIVIGGPQNAANTWIKRARAMRRQGRGVVLLSSAATAYIKTIRNGEGDLTTHWRDRAILEESGDYPDLVGSMAVKNSGFILSAGSGYTCELLIKLISPLVEIDEVAEIANRLLIETLRSPETPQPQGISAKTDLFDRFVAQAIKQMEAAISEPIPLKDLAGSLNLSSRQLERKFNLYLKMPPARYYKQMRVKRARILLLETRMRSIEVAIATGFSSTAALSRGLRDFYGVTCSQLRAER